MSVLSPLNVKRFDKYTIYINHTHLIHFLYTFQFVSILSMKINFFFSQTDNLEPPKPSSSSIASSSSKQTSGSSNSNLQIKPKKMAIPLDSFEAQSESPVDFASLKRNGRNGMDLESLIVVQEMFPYFEMLNGPTYATLVKDFWVRAEVYDVDAAKDKELKAVIRDPSLKGKTRQEMGLESFRQTEIRSSVLGILITITEEVIAKACRVAANGRFIWNAIRGGQ